MSTYRPLIIRPKRRGCETRLCFLALNTNHIIHEAFILILVFASIPQLNFHLTAKTTWRLRMMVVLMIGKPLGPNLDNLITKGSSHHTIQNKVGGCIDDE